MTANFLPEAFRPVDMSDAPRFTRKPPAVTPEQAWVAGANWRLEATKAADLLRQSKRRLAALRDARRLAMEIVERWQTTTDKDSCARELLFGVEAAIAATKEVRE